ncbi:replication-associated recombination protein A [Methylacidiphilum caldifontis]|uniref:replication-associated recombination protein A n=1 Tax=Methylacidiphilum caldifontis TaxID=2795386 RepID=UPI001A8E9193|nr:replication-associated recombination protein A [Methylacidiphilum caldifontis]QSR88020.1 replication-associated recombination protein A [Methylacidiphilum caldifontis]
MQELFEWYPNNTEQLISPTAPLATKMRPTTLEELVGQDDILLPGKPLRRLIDADRIQSLIFYGPPGTGKTTLAEIIAKKTKSFFERLNAVEAGVSEIRKVLSQATLRWKKEKRYTLLFIDEIHRFNKSQQDVLLPELETGIIKFIGATTHNPCFYLTAPLLSRSHLFEFKPLSKTSLESLLFRALSDKERGLGNYEVSIDPEAKELLLNVSEGDARRLLNYLEIAVLSSLQENKQASITIRVETIQNLLQKKIPRYDRAEDEHYDTISAFIKSVRGSDPDSALYWLAKMISAGEDPRFIARRLVILSTEDIGLANPEGLAVAVAAFDAIEKIGMPEGRIPLAFATLYLALSPKSNSAYQAIEKAMEWINNKERVEVPQALKDSHYSGAKKLGKGVGYLYSHNFKEAVSPQLYGIEPGTFYSPTDHGKEKEFKERLQYIKQLRIKQQTNSQSSQS